MSFVPESLAPLTWTMSLTLALALTGSAPIHAQTGPVTGLSEGWCELDAPGLYRALRSRARAAGTREIGACPTGGTPNELPRQLVIPLPCGRALDMVRIDVPASGVLDHFATSFGGAPEGASILTLYAQGGRSGTLTGTFSRLPDDLGGGPSIGYQDLGHRSYYMGSHEWTELQHSLVLSGALALWKSDGDRPSEAQVNEACSTTRDMAARLRFSEIMPAGGLSWYDAQAALGTLNDYVMVESAFRLEQGQQPLIPWEQGSSGFFRLPSEIEWEYAALGGAIGALDRLERHLVRTEEGTVRAPELSEIAVLSDGRIDGHLGPVGSLLPNVVGLHDTIGNVSELTHDLFSLVRPDVPHGGRGGVVLRGGNSLTPEAVIGIGHRLELPLHTVEGAGRSPFGGMRLMLAAPMLPRGYDPSGNRAPDLPNVELSEVMKLEHERLVAIRQTPGAEFRDQAQRLLTALQKDTATGSDLEAERISAVRRSLEQSEAAINIAQEAEIAARIRSAADAIFAMRSLSALAIVWHERLDEAEVLVATEFADDEKPTAEARIRQARAEVLARTGIIQVQVRDIARVVEDLAAADEDRVIELMSREKARLKESGIELYEEFLIWDKLGRAMSRVRQNQNEDHFSWMVEQFDVFRAERVEKWGG